MSAHADGSGGGAQPQNGSAPVGGPGDVEADTQTPSFYDVAHWYWPYWNDRSKDDTHDHITDKAERRREDIAKLDAGPFQKMVVWVAGAGFFVDGYLLFANNFALPIIGYLYWPADTYSDHETGINSATLSGAICGQIVLGFLADRFGRKKVYGWELLIVVVASLSISMASQGAIATSLGTPGSATTSGPIASPLTPGFGESSMRISAWLTFWRFVIGFGIGAEYPLTAAITSEWAPCKNRARMLATVFSMQSFGQCVAAIVAFAALRGGQMSLDASWRLIYGVAAIPAAFAMLIRFTIPETPRFLFDVQRNYRDGSHGVQAMTRGIKAPVPQRRSSRRAGPVVPFEAEDVLPPAPSFNDFMDYFFYSGGKWYSGNWTRLLGTAGTWLLLDLAFFGLGLNSPSIVTGLYKGCRNGTIAKRLGNDTWNSEPGVAYDAVAVFEDNEYAFWLIVSIGAITGSVTLIWAVNHVSRRKLQFGGFIGLACLFFIVGGILLHNVLFEYDGAWYLVVVIYALCQALFNFGPNALTFMFPAEIFPTRYRCFCLGISAAAGKFGSVIAQIALIGIQFNPLYSCRDVSDVSLGRVLIGFGFVMLAGAVMTWFLIPEVQHPNRESKTLGVLAKGRESRPPQPPPLQAPSSGGVELGEVNPTAHAQP